MNFYRISTATTIMVMVALSGHAQANCDRGDRIPAAQASCLEARWRNPSGLNALVEQSWYSVRNLCHYDGRVVAKVDIKNDMDHTLHLSDSRTRSRDIWSRVRGIYCCDDLSDLCSR